MQAFYLSERVDTDPISSSIGLISAVRAGDYMEGNKKYWLWKDRVAKVEELYKGIKKGLNDDHKVLLGELLDILNTNQYAKKKHGKKLKRLCKKMGFKGRVNTKKRKRKFFRRGNKK